MAEWFLREQLKRIRDMTEQMTQAQNKAAELTDEFARSRESVRHDPLQDVKDLRKYSYPDRETEQPAEHAGKAHRHLAHDSPRRRRRR